MPASTYLANKLLDHQVGKASFTMPTVYVALSSTEPTLAGGNVTEPSGGSYARVATSAATWNSAASGAIDNAQAIMFPTATADWASGANLPYGVLFDAATGGNMLAFGTFTNPKSALTDDTLSIPAGALDITLS